MVLCVVELPADVAGNTRYGYTVVEVELESTKYGYDHYRVISPDSFRQKWPSFMPVGWQETKGPARELTWEEWADVVGWRD